MAATIFNFQRMGNLRRYADRRDAAKQRNTRRAVAKAVQAIVGNRTVDALLREAARPPVDLEAITLRAMEADGVFRQEQPLPPIQDISQFGSTYCTLHRVTTVGNFCSACEHEAANARVPVRKPAPAPAAAEQGFLFCEKHGTRIKDACMQFCPKCEVEAMDDTNPDPDLGRLVTDGSEGGVR